VSTLKDPVRLVLDADCPQGQRALLRHDAGFEPPREAADQVWRGLAGALAAAGAATATPKATAAAKLVAVALALGALTAAIVLGTHLVAPPAAPPPAAAVAPPAPTSLPRLEPAAGGPSPRGDAPAPAAEHAQPFAAAKPAVRVKPRPPAPSGDESTLIEQARLALRSGDPTRALKLLEECRRVFPAGAREEERELLTIQALVSAVRGTEAKARAAAFLRKYPEGPGTGEIRALGLGTR
jgi:hypothetical protein